MSNNGKAGARPFGNVLATAACLLMSVSSSGIAADPIAAPSQEQAQTPPMRPVISYPRVLTRRLIYPVMALRYNQQGTVTVRYVVGADGWISAAKIVRSGGFPQLDAAALLSVGYWQDTPELKDGIPIDAISESNLVFVATDSHPTKSQWPDRPEPPKPVAADSQPISIKARSDSTQSRLDDGTYLFVLYPQIARRHNNQGQVILEVLVYEESFVRDAFVLKSSGSAQLDAAALVSAGYWTLLPAIKDNKPVDAWRTVTVDFELADSPAKTTSPPEGPILPNDDSVAPPPNYTRAPAPSKGGAP